MPDDCPIVNPVCVPGHVLDTTAGRFIEELSEQASEAAAEMLKALVAGWMSIPTPNVSQGSCHTNSAGKLVCDGTVDYLSAYTNWAVAALAVGAVLIGALRLAWERNGRDAGTLTRGLVTMVVLAGAGVPAVQLLIGIGDSYSDWILKAAADGDLGARLRLFAPAAATSGLAPLMAIGISIMMFLATMVQLLLLLARGAGLVLLAGLLPLAAASGIAGSGRAIRDRYLTWLLALVLYKPAAATIYAAVFWMLGKGQDLTTLLTGLVMFCMAIVALPALMRLIAPAVSVLSSGGSGGAAVAATSAAGQVASGAVRLNASSGASGGGPGAPTGGGGGRPGGASPSAPVPAPRPSGGGTRAGAAASGPVGAGSSTATTAGTTAAGTAQTAGAAGAATSAAGPAGVAVTAAQAGPATVRKVGGTASGATGGEGA
ncbi:hypothetical protein [Micromonospora sp. NPDC047074]|uniref:hypothetical protein n=1 Tax=Micromonospora sp. NPDC047074 TaxID=3154339 RepID=UPI00340B8AF0